MEGEGNVRDKGEDVTDCLSEEEFASYIAAAGGRLYVVGGYVRDLFLGKLSHDRDYVVTGLTTEAFEAMFAQIVAIGKAFSVYRMCIDGAFVDVAMARREHRQGVGHTAFSVISDGSVTLFEDLKRRDFTVNAMAIDVVTGQLFDPFHGKVDAVQKKLRAVSPAFREDPLRVYRAARFCCELAFTIDKETFCMMRSMRRDLAHLSVERVFEECHRAMLTSDPIRFFTMLNHAGVLSEHFPEIVQLSDDYEQWQEIQRAVTWMVQNSSESFMRFAAIAYALPLLDKRSLYLRLKFPKLWQQALEFVSSDQAYFDYGTREFAKHIETVLSHMKRSIFGMKRYCTVMEAIATAQGNGRAAFYTSLPQRCEEIEREVRAAGFAASMRPELRSGYLRTQIEDRLFTAIKMML